MAGLDLRGKCALCGEAWDGVAKHDCPVATDHDADIAFWRSPHATAYGPYSDRLAAFRDGWDAAINAAKDTPVWTGGPSGEETLCPGTPAETAHRLARESAISPVVCCAIADPSPKPHTCPVCAGNGKRPAGFYDTVTGSWSGTAVSIVQCRSCVGTGVVWG